MRYLMRNQGTACKVLINLEPAGEKTEEEFKELCDSFGNHIGESLRKSDLFMKSRFNRYFVLLSDIRQDSIEKVVGELLREWHDKNPDRLQISYETEFVGVDDNTKYDHEVRVAVVDDDTANLQVAGHILSKNGFYVTALKSGQALLDYLEKTIPDAILLDIKMPGMDGFETLTELRKTDKGKDIPVIFLTADEKEGTEVKGLSLGAMDFVKKPFVPEVLTTRVRHIIDLCHLQRDFLSEVEKKVKEIMG
jgi:CheY-like chemotaxis protein